MPRPLSEREAKWLRDVQKVLDRCPSPKTLGFYTVGDNDVTVYRRPKDDFLEWDGDFCEAVDGADARLGELSFPNQVHSTAG